MQMKSQRHRRKFIKKTDFGRKSRNVRNKNSMNKNKPKPHQKFNQAEEQIIRDKEQG